MTSNFNILKEYRHDVPLSRLSTMLVPYWVRSMDDLSILLNDVSLSYSIGLLSYETSWMN